LLQRCGDVEPLRLEPRERPRELALPRDGGDKTLFRVLGIGVARRKPRVESVFLPAEPLEILLDRGLPRLQRFALVREALARFRFLALLRTPLGRVTRSSSARRAGRARSSTQAR